MSDTAEQKALTEIERTLTQEFPHIAPTIVKSVVQKALSSFSESRIRDYLPLFVEKNARRQLSVSTDLAETA